MPNNGINRAKQKRAGSLGQSARLYNFKTCNGNITIPGSQGFTTGNASIGSVLSLGVVKQNRKAGGNNVCLFGTKCLCIGPKAGCPKKILN